MANALGDIVDLHFDPYAYHWQIMQNTNEDLLQMFRNGAMYALNEALTFASQEQLNWLIAESRYWMFNNNETTTIVLFHLLIENYAEITFEADYCVLLNTCVSTDFADIVEFIIGIIMANGGNIQVICQTALRHLNPNTPPIVRIACALLNHCVLTDAIYEQVSEVVGDMSPLLQEGATQGYTRVCAWILQ
jgi:hypothetical protein